MADRKGYIERGALLKCIDDEYDLQYGEIEIDPRKFYEMVEAVPTADVVEVDMVAEMLYQACGDDCPCNFNGIDEWLPEVCDLLEECPYPQGEFACWKQYIKHYGERKDGAK